MAENTDSKRERLMRRVDDSTTLNSLLESGSHRAIAALYETARADVAGELEDISWTDIADRANVHQSTVSKETRRIDPDSYEKDFRRPVADDTFDKTILPYHVSVGLGGDGGDDSDKKDGKAINVHIDNATIIIGDEDDAERLRGMLE